MGGGGRPSSASSDLGQILDEALKISHDLNKLIGSGTARNCCGNNAPPEGDDDDDDNHSHGGSWLPASDGQ